MYKYGAIYSACEMNKHPHIQISSLDENRWCFECAVVILFLRYLCTLQANFSGKQIIKKIKEWKKQAKTSTKNSKLNQNKKKKCETKNDDER